MRDVVGPEDGKCEVYLWLNGSDSHTDDIFRDCADAESLAEHLNGLSTNGRFQRFARDFLSEAPAAGSAVPSQKFNTASRKLTAKPTLSCPCVQPVSL